MKKAIVICAVMTLCVTSMASAVSYDQNVTPGVIFGSGNANGSFAVGTGGGVELGMRAKIRFDATGQPQNTFNSDGAGAYTFQAGRAVNQTVYTPVWGVDFSINSDYADANATGNKLNAFRYEFSVDTDPGTGVNLVTFDPITPTEAKPYWDHSIGINLTTDQTDTIGNATNYVSLIANNNVAQNTTRINWLTSNFDPTQTGTYSFSLAAFSGDTEVARTAMNVHVVPEPATMGLLVMGGVSLLIKRRRNHA